MDLVNKGTCQELSFYRALGFTSALLHDPLSISAIGFIIKDFWIMLPEGLCYRFQPIRSGRWMESMLIDIFASRRPDFKGDGGCDQDPGRWRIISYPWCPIPTSEGESGECQWRSTIPATLERRSSDGFLPTGAISFYNKSRYRIYRWAHGVIRLVRKAETPGIPCLF